MSPPVTFQRIYEDGQGIEYPASPAAVDAVLRSMNSGQSSPFKVRFRFDDAPPVTASPKRRR